MRAISLAALLYIVASPAVAQTAGDSTPPSPNPDRYVIDAAKLVRESGARSFSDLLVGQVPGLLVIPGWGLNGSGARIRFAGVRSVVDDAPLILVDGMRVDAAENASLLGLSGPGPWRLEDLSVEEVESIEVFRGPVSGAMYGPGAANGVISIHTKGGRSGTLQVETHAQGAFEVVSSNWPANYGGVDADNANPRMRDGGCNLSEQAAGQCVQDFVQSFNPLVQRRPFETVLRRQVGFSASGGPSWGAFRLAGAFDRDAGPYALPGVSRTVDNFQRWSLRGSGSMQPFPGLDIGFGLARVSSDLRLPTYVPILAALRGPSTGAQFTWDSLFRYPGGERLERTSGTMEVRGAPWTWLTFRAALGRDDVDQRDGLLEPGQFRYDGRRRVRHDRAALSASLRSRVNGSIRFEATIGLERLARRIQEDQAQGRDTTPLCSAPCAISFLRLKKRSMGTYVTAAVVSRDRLFITGALRHDHFDEFHVGATNPSLSVSWVARAHAPGATGLLTRLTLHGAYASAGAPPHENAVFIVGLPQPASPLRPDRTRSFEFGGNADLFGERWRAGLTFYDAHSDVVTLQLISTPSGCCFYDYVGGTTISNRGVAVTIGGRVLDRATLGWDLQLSMWGNRNRLVAVGGAPYLNGFQYFAPGYPVGFYAAPRMRSYADANGDGVIVAAEVVIDSQSGWAGTPYPTQGAALTSGWRFGRWRVSTLFEYRAGHVLLNYLEWTRCARFTPTCRGRNDPTASLEAQAVAAAAPWTITTDYYEDADFLTLRDLSVSFDVPAGAMSVLHARGATITLIGRNLLTWTGYSGIDPEAGSYPLSFLGASPSVQDNGTLPPLRSWTLRVQLAY